MGQVDMSQHSSSGGDWKKVRQVVLQRDGFVCVVCGNAATHVDHIIPKAAGGTDDLDNLQAMCATHNLKKGTKQQMRGTYWLADALPNGLPKPKGT